MSNTCPGCNGEKVMRGLGKPAGGGPCVPVEIECVDCDGRGEVDDLELRRLWQRTGSLLRRMRETRGETMGAAARRLGVTVAELSDAELGRFDPDPLLAKLQSAALERFR